MTMRAAAVVALLGACPVAAAWEVVAVPVDGALRPGVPAAVWVAVAGDDGLPVASAPVLRSPGAEIWPLRVATPPQVYPFAVVPEGRGTELAVTVEVAGRSTVVRLPMQAPLRPPLRISDGLVADARDARVSLLVQGEDLPAPEDLVSASSEGRVVAVERVLLGLLVTVQLAEVPYPRVVVVGVRDARGDAPPVWGTVRLRARLSVPVETEPGATASLRIGEREWGPVTADERGVARLVVEQDPDDRAAELTVRDVSGNETVRELPLSTVDRPVLVPLPGGLRVPEEEPPPLWLFVADHRGDPWTGERPMCRTPATGALDAVRVGPGRYVVSPPPVGAGEVFDARVRCGVAGLTEVDTVVPLAPGLPSRLELRVWPEELSTDFPVADVQISLLDPAGERVAAAGELTMSATNGAVRLRDGGGPVWRADYQGSVAAELGQDTITARWNQAAGEGPMDRLRVLVAEVGRVGSASVWLRALDRERRPLRDEVLSVRTDSGQVAVRTDARGWALAVVPTPPGSGPVVLRVESDGGRTFQAVVQRGSVGAAPAPVDLVARLDLRVDPGRLATVELAVEPAVVRPGRTAELRALFFDRADRPIAAEGAQVTATEGRLEALEPGADGARRWRWTPPPGIRPREVELIARDEVLDVEERVTVRVRSAPTAAAFGVSGGVQTNFSRLTAPTASLDVGVWLRGRRAASEDGLSPSRLFLLAHAGWYAGRAEIDSGVGPLGSVRMDLFPVGVALALRQEYPTQAVWVGVGGQIAVWAGALDFDDTPWVRRTGVLAPALYGVLGYGRRVGSGELFVEISGSSLTSPGGDAMLSGPVGGLAARAGYRVLFGAGGRGAR